MIRLRILSHEQYEQSQSYARQWDSIAMNRHKQSADFHWRNDILPENRWLCTVLAAVRSVRVRHRDVWFGHCQSIEPMSNGSHRRSEHDLDTCRWIYIDRYRSDRPGEKQQRRRDRSISWRTLERWLPACHRHERLVSTRWTIHIFGFSIDASCRNPGRHVVVGPSLNPGYMADGHVPWHFRGECRLERSADRVD